MEFISFLRNVRTGRVLDSNHTGHTYTLDLNGGYFQQWLFRPAGFDWMFDMYTLQNVATGRLLDSNANGTVYTLPANGGPYQLWIKMTGRQDGFLLMNRATRRVLDSNFALPVGSVYTLRINGGNFQSWNTL